MSERVDTGWVSVAAKGGRLDAPLDVPTAIRARRATKQFKTDPLPEGVLDKLIELTAAAPSSFNIQDWRIVVVTGSEQKQALAAAAYNQSQVLNAPAVFVFAADSRAWSPEHLEPIFEQARARGAWPDKVIEYYKNAIPGGQEALGPAKQREYAIKGAMVAAAHLLLAAASFGVDSCPMNGWIEDEVKKVIGAGDNPDIGIACIVAVGYGEGGLGDPGRLPHSKTVFIDRMDNPYEE